MISFYSILFATLLSCCFLLSYRLIKYLICPVHYYYCCRQFSYVNIEILFMVLIWLIVISIVCCYLFYVNLLFMYCCLKQTVTINYAKYDMKSYDVCYHF